MTEKKERNQQFDGLESKIDKLEEEIKDMDEKLDAAYKKGTILKADYDAKQGILTEIAALLDGLDDSISSLSSKQS